MEKVPQKANSRETLALILIGIGLLWILKQTGVFFNFPFFHLENIFNPIRNVFQGISHVVFSWPMILIVIGVVLLAGKRSGGLVLLIIGAIFILPKIIFFSGAAIFLLFPLVLIGLGIALVARLL
jgi:hypothetical protein